MSAKMPIFAGSSSGMVPSTGAALEKAEHGIDVMNRPFTCPRSSVQNMIPAKGTPDIFYPNLRATGNYRISEDAGTVCTLSVEYKGFLNGAVPIPTKTRSKSLQMVQIPFIISVPIIPVQYKFDLLIQFLAIKTTWFWYDDKKPGDTPRFSGVDSNESPWDNIIFFQAKYGEYAFNAEGFLKELKDGGRMVDFIQSQNYQVEEIVPGYLWQCSHDVMNTINPIQNRFVKIIA